MQMVNFLQNSGLCRMLIGLMQSVQLVISIHLSLFTCTKHGLGSIHFHLGSCIFSHFEFAYLFACLYIGCIFSNKPGVCILVKL